MKTKLLLAAMLAIAALGYTGCATHSHHTGKNCDGSCCKAGAEACAKCCGTDCAACCKK